MVWHWFRKPAGEIPYRFKSCTLRNEPQECLNGIRVVYHCARVEDEKAGGRRAEVG